MYNGYNTIPAGQDYINYYNGMYSPSTLHCRNNALHAYFVKYLLQKAMSVFEWELPKTWSENYFLYTLYTWGFVGVLETDKYGVICQGSGIEGYDIYYQPSHIVVTNPLLKETKPLRIGVECEVIRLTPDWSGIIDMINYYADQMAITAEATTINIMNSKLSYVFSAKNKAGAESLKKILDQIMGGNIAVFYDEKLRRANPTGGSEEPWNTFAQDLRSNFIAPDLQDSMRRWEELFNNEIGIDNVRSDKKERLITAEANANNFECRCKAELWLDTLKKCVEKVNKMFGTNIRVDWRHDATVNGGNNNGSNNTNGTVNL